MADGTTPGAGRQEEAPAYRAFISYSHRDKAVVQWLHRTVESYRIPAKLVGTTTSVGVVPKRPAPIFRDRDELPASADLGAELNAALRRSMFLMVICSPASAKSHWVTEEIKQFKQMQQMMKGFGTMMGRKKGKKGKGGKRPATPMSGFPGL